MALSYEEAVARLTAPGQVFELTDVTVRGVDYRSFVHAPPTLRAVFDAARRHGERTFLVYEGERWSFERVMAEADALAASLAGDFGVAKGDRVAIAMRNLPEWVVAFGAITSLGAVSVSLNAWWSEDELSYALEDSGTSVLVADPERADRAGAPCARLDIPVVVARAASPTPAGARCRRHREGRAAGRPCTPGPTWWSRAAVRRWCPSTPTTTPPSCTPRARPAGPKGPCRPTAR